MRRVVKQIVIIIAGYYFVSYIQNCIQHPAVNINPICRGKYWVSSMWIST